MTQTQRSLRARFWLLVSVIVAPVIALVGCAVVTRLNKPYGHMVYHLPAPLGAIFALGVIGSALLAVNTFWAVWENKAVLWYVDNDADARLRDRVVVAGLAAVLLEAFWVVLAPWVYFASGGGG